MPTDKASIYLALDIKDRTFQAREIALQIGAGGYLGNFMALQSAMPELSPLWTSYHDRPSLQVQTPVNTPVLGSLFMVYTLSLGRKHPSANLLLARFGSQSAGACASALAPCSQSVATPQQSALRGSHKSEL